MEIDPDSLEPMPGKLVIQVVEVLGGMTRGGIFVPGTTQDHAGKDTAYGRVVKMGPLGDVVKRGRDGSAEYAGGDRAWPESYRSVGVGDVVVVPRDVPVVFGWRDARYAIVLEHEVIVAIPGAEFDSSGFEVVPWRPPELPAGFGS